MLPDRTTEAIQKDLFWLLNSPNLVLPPSVAGVCWLNGAFMSAAWARVKPLVASLPESINEGSQLNVPHLLPPKTKRLGDYAEWLVALWLVLDPAYELVARNIQLFSESPENQKKSQTLGELDFVIRDVFSKELIHMEVAVKFYMQLLPEPRLQNLIGSNPNDRLDKKLTKMQWHQLMLSQDSDVQSQILERFGQTIQRRWGLMKGGINYTEFSETINDHAVVNALHEQRGIAYVAGIAELDAKRQSGLKVDKRELLACQPAQPLILSKMAESNIECSSSELFDELIRYPCHWYDQHIGAQFLMHSSWWSVQQSHHRKQQRYYKTAYENAHYRVLLDDGRSLDLRVKQTPLFWPWLSDGVLWFMTAYNPAEMVLSAIDNQTRSAWLEQHLIENNLPYWQALAGDHQGEHVEQGFVVTKMSRQQACGLGGLLGQAAILRITQQNVELVML